MKKSLHNSGKPSETNEKLDKLTDLPQRLANKLNGTQVVDYLPRLLNTKTSSVCLKKKKYSYAMKWFRYSNK